MTVNPVDVSGTLEEAQLQYQSTRVLNIYDLDVGSLTAFDPNALDEALLFQSSDQGKQEYLTSIARDGVQLLLNEIFSLPTIKKRDIMLATLPRPTTRLPRFKPIPKEKLKTKWQKFAETKGIKKIKKASKEFNNATGEWVQTYGYKHAVDKMDDWLVEVPAKSDPMEDQFEMQRAEKKTRVQRNDKRAQRNANEEAAVESGQDLKSIRKKQLESALKLTKNSTASLGKFDTMLKNENEVKLKAGIKRKFEETAGDSEAEKKRLMAVAEKVLCAKTRPVLNLKKAVSHVTQSKNRPKLADHSKSKKKTVFKRVKGRN